MYCKFCGKQISDNSIFCSFCGKRLDDATPAVSTGAADVDLSALEDFFTDAVNKKEAEKDFTILGGVLLEYKGAGGRVTVPDGVTAINENVFIFNRKITSIVFPEGLISIGDSAFSDCDNLSEVKFPSTLTSIGDKAFYGCLKLTKINLPDGLKSLGSAAFMCSGIESVAIPGSVEVIKGNPDIFNPGPFSYCENLTTIVISPGVKKLDVSAFKGCYALTNIVLPHGLTEIGKCAFASCGKLTAIKIPSTVTEIDDEAFDDCNSLGSINIPGSVKRIGKSAFRSCGIGDGDQALHSVIIEEGVQEIDNFAFQDCIRLSYIKLPDSLQIVGNFPFLHCDSLSKMRVPRGVTDDWLAHELISGCSSIKCVEAPEHFRNAGWKLFGDATVSYY